MERSRMTIRIMLGDAMEQLRNLPDKSVHCCVTSPPYWGLRDYGIPPTIWCGDPACEHDFADESIPTEVGKGNWAQGVNGRGELQPGGVDAKREPVRAMATRGFCRCGAWRGAFGLEPTPALYVEHAVMIFREVGRVLRDDGTLWLNLGDSYATGAGAVGARPGGGAQGDKWAGHDIRDRDAARRPHGRPMENGRGEPQTIPGYRGGRNGPEGKHGYGEGGAGIGPMTQPNRMPQEGLKPKDLCEIPSDVVRALRDDGWWLRSRIPWLKRNAMPESTKDRPTTAVEYVFLLSKSERYFYDGEAVKIACASGPSDIKKMRESLPRIGGKHKDLTDPLSKASAATNIGQKRSVGNPEGRARRNSDWFFESWQGMLQDDGGDPLALIVNPQPFKEAHFATFPPSLIEPCILAGCPQGGTVLDPFGGAGTTGLVADRLQRDAVLIELNPEYAATAEKRIHADGPLFSEVTT